MGSGGSRSAGTGSRGRPGSADTASYYNRHRGVRNNRRNSWTESDITRRPRPYSEATEELLKVSDVDLDILKNTRAHRTHEFDVVNERDELIIRRGQEFNINIKFNRAYDSKKDDLRFVFQFGSRPRPSNGTHVEFALSDQDLRYKWGAYIKSNEGNILSLGVMSAPICAVGKWSLKIDVVKRVNRDASVFRYIHPAPIYILFNPWCKDDHVYMKEDTKLEEYVMNETGFIYAGDGKIISPKPWVFGQFEGQVFDCVMYLLEMSGLPDYYRGYPVQVARSLSRLVNSSDDGGVLVGNWSGEYSGGTSPLAWTGSEAILEEYLNKKRPVKFGQCWVFSGVLTTVCRALGLPARSLTNFQSAHDTDGSITIDKHFDENGKPKDNSDSIWNFHVWNDVWMARPDLPPGYGGWQAVDATPQEMSNGLYQMGPMSLLAIKRGEVFYPYDGQFAFGEVNADIVYWRDSADGKTEIVNLKPKNVGVKISTKLPSVNDREDVTDSYKFQEGTDEERAAVIRANVHATDKKGKELYEASTKDVTFKLNVKPGTFMGDAVNFGLMLKNNSNERRTIWGNLGFSSMYYTGVTHQKIKGRDIDYTVLEAQEERYMDVDVDVNEYLNKLTDHCFCMASCMCVVQETYQAFADTEDIRLRKPHLQIQKAPKTAKVGEKFKVDVSFDNPLSETLTNCELRIEAPGIQKPVIHKQQNVGARQTYTGYFELCPARHGNRQIVVYFNCKQILSVNVSHSISVKD